MCVTLLFFMSWLFVSFHHLFRVDFSKRTSQAFGGLDLTKPEKHTHTHTQERTAELGLVISKCNHKGFKNTHTHTDTHTAWCCLSDRPLYCGIVWTISSWMIKRFISRPSLWWWARLITRRARVRFQYVCTWASNMFLCPRPHLMAWGGGTWTRGPERRPGRVPIDCAGLLTSLPTAASACEKLLSGPFNGGTLIWGKGCKVMGKESFVSTGSWGSESWADVFMA